MKNIITLIFISSSFLQTAFSQTVTAAGLVKDEQGKPIPGAMISEFKSKPASATYTDSLGFFSFPIGVYAKLSIRCSGYNDTVINMADNKHISIILSKSKVGKHSNNTADNSDNPLIKKNLLQDAVST